MTPEPVPILRMIAGMLKRLPMKHRSGNYRENPAGELLAGDVAEGLHGDCLLGGCGRRGRGGWNRFVVGLEILVECEARGGVFIGRLRFCDILGFPFHRIVEAPVFREGGGQCVDGVHVLPIVQFAGFRGIFDRFCAVSARMADARWPKATRLNCKCR